jgi:hypothetical protein
MQQQRQQQQLQRQQQQLQRQQQQQPNAEQQVQNISEMNATIAKMKALVQNRAIPTSLIKKVGAAIITNYKDDEDDGVVKYTRDGLDRLIEQRPALKLSINDASDDGYFNKLFFMFQIYVAFINALTNTANMSASVIFGNLTLKDAFTKFLVNVLNMVLKTNVTDLTPDQLRDLLQKNRPVIQQISAIIIDEASQLLVGLSDVCSDIAENWIKDVLPGLVKSAAIGIPSAVEAAIPPLGEVVDIVNTALALMGSFMKVVHGIQGNSDNIFKGVGLVKDAYKSLQDIQNLLTDPSAATSAVLNPRLNVAAQNFVNDRVASAATAASARIMPSRGGGKKMKSRRYLKDPKKFKSYISKIRNKTAKKEVELINSMRELKNM